MKEELNLLSTFYCTDESQGQNDIKQYGNFEIQLVMFEIKMAYKTKLLGADNFLLITYISFRRERDKVKVTKSGTNTY